jgi:hypothetical protein
MLQRRQLTNRKALISRWKGIGQPLRLAFVGAVLATAIIPAVLTNFGYQFSQSLLAVVLMETCLYPTVRYFAYQESGLPAMAIFCLAYALQFALPFFTHEAVIELAQRETKYLSDADVTAALLMAMAGVCAIQIGYYWFRNSEFSTAVPMARLNLNQSKAIIFCVVVGLLLPVLFNLKNIIPEEYQQPLSAILRLLQNQVYVVIGVLGWLVYARKVSIWFKVWLYGLVLITAVRGVSTGTLEEALIPIGVLFLVKWLHTRRISFAMIAAVLAVIVFLSPVKSEYRQQVWFDEAPEVAEMSSGSKALLWITQATEYWSDTLSGSHDLAEATASATGRADFIHQVAHIHSMTPSVVPYQYGETYSYFAVAVIPRILWPNKPTAGNANAFYAVNYGITTEEGAKTTTFGVSILGEAFINFGWYGVVLMMLLQGLVIGLLERIFGGPQSGAGGQAVFIAFFVFFLNGIGSSAEILFGNILQNLLCGYFLLLWAREKGSHLRLGTMSQKQLYGRDDAGSVPQRV